ncbi:type II toxin-antitoxin system RelE/ParE family toxin [Nostoc sp. ATCC 53789]|uniref:type II toxin-antitoxin system RelE/ParE family toxin n=1 Tax=Nostoc sp. ATCC 53789 TaxID=76335 RepID=UPI000DEC1C80|nr:type II toxin-antitoxin system RelE/ParE family toxin [Nostoc sp. ATCC 53789]QHG18911.1 type II toxin-antitoxin system RelE/ParE family toxin [Nostoc sp. ATCC 53789]RCJ22746.1 plasmid stabilization system protein [Nostoc sp. ATCC 53789]
MSYQVLIQPTAFQEIEMSYRWMCDNLGAEVANNWYYELQDAIASLQEFPNRCSIAPEVAVIGREIRQLWVGKRRKYRVLFVVKEEIVAILHVRHSRQSYLGEESE